MCGIAMIIKEPLRSVNFGVCAADYIKDNKCWVSVGTFSVDAGHNNRTEARSLTCESVFILSSSHL